MKQSFKICFLLGMVLFTFACSKDADGGETAQAFEVKIECSNNYPAMGEPMDVKIKTISGTVESAQWDWGDGTLAQGISATHQYVSEGEFTLTLTAKDIHGKTVSVSEKVEVEGTGLTKFIEDYDRKKVLIMAHRGNTGNRSIPENSLASLDACIANKDVLDFVEIDPRMTKDGVIILMHDKTVDRTTTGAGKVEDMTYKEIKRLRLKLRNGKVTTQSVPTLEDFLLKARGRVFINLDFVDKVPAKEIYDLVRKCGMLDRVIFTVGTKKDVAETMLGYTDTIHILGQYSNDGDENFLTRVGGGNRISFTYITPAKALSTGYSALLLRKGFIPTSQILNQKGFTYDSQMMNRDYTGIDLFLEKNFLLLQTDYPKNLHAYLKSKGKR